MSTILSSNTVMPPVYHKLCGSDTYTESVITSDLAMAQQGRLTRTAASRDLVALIDAMGKGGDGMRGSQP